MLPLRQQSSSSFPLDPKFTLNQLSCQQSALRRAGLFVSEAATAPSPLCDTVLLFSGVWDIIFSALRLSYLVKSFCFVYKQYVRAHTSKDVQTGAGTCVYLSCSCLERLRPIPIPWGLVLNKMPLWANTVCIHNVLLAVWAIVCVCLCV